MKKTLRVVKDYSDVQERNVFIANKQSTTPNIGNVLVPAVQYATTKICVVLESGLTDSLTPILLNNLKARKYIIVPEIKEDKYKDIANKAIIREVRTIKGNYLIIDEKQLFVFDADLNGIEIIDNNAISTVQQIFMHEFWSAEAKFEYIDKKEPSAEITFDLQPVYGNESLLFDFSQGDKTEVEKLICSGTEYGFVDKIDQQQSMAKLVIKTLSSNKAFLEKTNNDNIVYAPTLPFSFVRRGEDIFALNFDAEKYAILPEREKGRLFAVKCQNKINIGSTYRFVKHKTRRELLGIEALDSDGKKLEITKDEAEEREISVDLNQAQEYLKMPKEILEERLQTKYPNILNSDKKVCEVTFNITVDITKHKLQKRANIYTAYEEFNKAINQKTNELKNATESAKLNDLQAKFRVPADNLSTVKECHDVLQLVNSWVDEYAKTVSDKLSIDNNLAEVKGSDKNKKLALPTITKISPNLPLMDLPKFGMLYQDGNRYEYVIKVKDGKEVEHNLDAAQKEMAVAGINENLTYHLE